MVEVGVAKEVTNEVGQTLESLEGAEGLKALPCRLSGLVMVQGPGKVVILGVSWGDTPVRV